MARFGAVGDGRTDDRAAIQAALDAVPVGGAVVRFPAGVFQVAGTQGDTILTLRPGTSLRGESRSASTLRVAPGTGSWGAFLEYENPSIDPGSLAVSDLTFDMNSRANPVVDNPQATNRPRMVIRSAGGAGPSLSIVGCRFHDCSNVNTLYLAGRRVVVRDCLFTGTGAGAVGGWDHSSIYAVARSGGSISITGNRFVGTLGSGASRTAIETHGGSQIVQQNTIDAYLKGMNLTGVAQERTDTVVVASNTISNALIPFHLWAAPYANQPSGTTLSNVLLRANHALIDPAAWRDVPGATGVYACGVLLDPQAGCTMLDITVRGNTFRWTGELPPPFRPLDERACGVTFKSAGVLSGLQILGNTFETPPSAGVLLDGSVVTATVSGNVFLDPGRLAASLEDATLASGVVLGGRIDGAVVTGNRTTDRRRPHVVAQGVASRSGLLVTRSRVSGNQMQCSDGTVPPEMSELMSQLV